VLAEVQSAEALEGIGQALYLECDYTASIEHYEQAYTAYRKDGVTLGAARAARMLAWICGNVLGDWAVQSGWLARARTILEEAGGGRPEYGLDESDVLLVRLAALPVMLLTPLAGWLVGRHGSTRVAVAGYLLAAAGLTLQAVSAAVLWPLVVASVVYVAGIAMTVPAVIALVGSRAGSTRAGALGLTGLAVFTGASLGALAAELSLQFASLLLVLAALLIVGGALVALSGRQTADVMPREAATTGSWRIAGTAKGRRTG
jgi:MFS family permease